MSDCSTNANGPYDVARLRIEFQDGEVPWMYPLALNGRTIEAVFVDGRRYVPAADRDWDSEVRDDSAKKLEEDVIGCATLSYYGDGTIRLDSSYMDRASLADVFDWLDRRSLITKRELSAGRRETSTAGQIDSETQNRMPEQAIAATLGGGKLTAEQVSEVIRKYAEDDSCYIFEVYGEMCGPIADELNAELGSDECEFRPFKDEDWSEPNAVRGVCSECSALMYGKDNYCPNCGRKVVR